MPPSDDVSNFRLRDSLQSYDMIASQKYDYLRVFINILSKYGKNYELGVEYKNTPKDTSVINPDFEELNFNDFDFDPEDF